MNYQRKDTARNGRRSKNGASRRNGEENLKSEVWLIRGRITPRPISKGPFFPQRGTWTAAENYPGWTTQSAQSRPISRLWANRESRRAGRCGMVGLIAAHHLPTTLQRSTSLLRDLYAVSSRARTHARTHILSDLLLSSLPRHVLNWRV